MANLDAVSCWRKNSGRDFSQEGFAVLGKRAACVAGFAYGFVLAVYAASWGTHVPTLTMPLAASPIIVPAAFLSDPSIFRNEILRTTLLLIPIVFTPLFWSAIAFLIVYGRSIWCRVGVVSALFAHYVGAAIWFYVASGQSIRWAMYVLRAERPYLVLFYVAGQDLLWLSLLFAWSRRGCSPPQKFATT